MTQPVTQAVSEAIALIDEIIERKPSRVFHGINQPLHAKLCTIRATLARANVNEAFAKAIAEERERCREIIQAEIAKYTGDRRSDDDIRYALNSARTAIRAPAGEVGNG